MAYTWNSFHGSATVATAVRWVLIVWLYAAVWMLAWEDSTVKDPQVSVKDGQLVLVVDVPRAKLTLRGRRTGDRLEGKAEFADEPKVAGFIGVATTDEKVADAGGDVRWP